MKRRTFLKGLGSLALLAALDGRALLSAQERSSLYTFEEPFLKKQLYGSTTNGLDLYFRQMRRNTSEFHLTARLGGHDRLFKDAQDKIQTFPGGAAHLLEHLVFKKKDGDVHVNFKRYGMATNAYTTTDHTTYFFTASENWQKGLEMLLDFVFHREYNKEDVEGERKIVLEEWRGRNDNPDRLLMENLYKALYFGPYADPVIGTQKEIETVTFETLNKAYDLFYIPRNMFFNGAGPQDPKEVFALIAERLAAMGVTEGEPVQLLSSSEPVHIRQADVVAEERVQYPRVLLAFKHPYTMQLTPQQRFKETITLEILADILLGSTSAIQKELRTANILTSEASGGYSNGRGYGFTDFYGSTTNPAKMEEIVLHGIASMKQTGVPAKQFRLSQRAIKGIFVRLFEDRAGFLRAFRSYMVEGANVMDYLQIANSITVKDMEALLHSDFTGEKYAKSVLLPKKKRGI